MLSPILGVTTGLCLHQISLQHMIYHPSKKRCSTSPDNNKITPKKGSIFCMGDHNTQKMMTLNKTRITVAIANLIISEGISFSLAQKHKFKKVLDLARNMSKFSNIQTEIVYTKIFRM